MHKSSKISLIVLLLQGSYFLTNVKGLKIKSKELLDPDVEDIMYEEIEPYERYEPRFLQPESSDQVHDLYEDVNATTTVSPIKRTVIPLTLTSRPEHVFNISLPPNSPGIEYQFELGEELPGGFMGYMGNNTPKISVTIERMACSSRVNRNDNDYSPPSLKLQNKDISMTFGCRNFNNIQDRCQSVREVIDGQPVVTVTVSALGDWYGIDASLVASIYYEVPYSCEYCDPSHFCCGHKRSPCPSSKVTSSKEKVKGWSFQDGDLNLYRCIPQKKFSRQVYFEALNGGSSSMRRADTFDVSDLICNNHPNCGFYCNRDESSEVCDSQDSDGNCFGRSCNFSDVAVRILILVIFCFLLPPVIILFLCRFQSIRRSVNRLRNRVLPGDANSGSDSRVESEVTIASEARPSEIVPVPRNRGPPPPRYNESSSSTPTTPPPSYENAVRDNKSYECPSLSVSNHSTPSLDAGSIGSNSSSSSRGLNLPIPSQAQTHISQSSPSPQPLVIMTSRDVNGTYGGAVNAAFEAEQESIR